MVDNTLRAPLAVRKRSIRRKCLAEHRGYSRRLCRWFYGYLIEDVGGSSFIEDRASGVLVKVEKESIGIFTGILDEDNTKVFTGDIVRGEDERDNFFIGVIENDIDTFLINSEDIIFYDWFEYSFEVVSNIYEHPELVEEKNYDKSRNY